MAATMPEVRSRIECHQTLDYEHIRVLVEAYIYGTATPMRALIHTLRIMRAGIEQGNTYQYWDEKGLLHTIDAGSLQAFILQYFDDFTVREVMGEDSCGMYD